MFQLEYLHNHSSELDKIIFGSSLGSWQRGPMSPLFATCVHTDNGQAIIAVNSSLGQRLGAALDGVISANSLLPSPADQLLRSLLTPDPSSVPPPHTMRAL